MTVSSKEQLLTHTYLREILSYDPETGVFRWRVRMGTQALKGDIAGHIGKKGRRMIAIKRKYYFASRLAWFYVHGAWPLEFVDHINLVRDDDRICNLRAASRKENSANMRPHKDKISCNLKGVTKRIDRHGRDRWRARIRVDGKLINLGDHDTPEIAHAAYWRAAQQHFGEFAHAE